MVGLSTIAWNDLLTAQDTVAFQHGIERLVFGSVATNRRLSDPAARSSGHCTLFSTYYIV